MLVVGGGFGIASTLRRVQWATFASALAHLSPLPVALALGVSTLQVFAQLARFAVLVPRAARTPLRELLDATAVGQLLNSTTALRAGDAYKLARLSSNAEDPKWRLTKLAAALVIERVADIVALVFVTAWTLGSLSGALSSSAVFTDETASHVAIAAAIGAIALSWIARRLPGAAGLFARDTWEAISSPRFARCFVVAVGTWILDATTLYWTARSVGCPITLRTAIPCVFLLNVGTAIPVTVGNLGIFEVSLAFALSRYGIAPERALVIATLEHVAKLAGLVLCIGILRLGPRGRDL